MNMQTFITKAAAQGQYIGHVNPASLTCHQRQLHLDSQCVCCEGDVEVEGVYDIVDNGDHLEHLEMGYAADLLCQGCMDNVPAEVLLKLGIMSQKEYDNLCDPFDDYTPMDSNDLRDILDPEYDCSPPTQYWEEPSVGGMYDCGDDELPF